LVDPSFIQRLEKMGGVKLRDDLINMYIERTPERLREITDGLAGKHFESIARAAHSLISSAGNLGGTGVSALASRLEASALANDLEQAQALFIALEKACDDFRTHLNTIMDES
jgi:HPt (histidine-containing phosphotransfer) domain-containing protein